MYKTLLFTYFLLQTACLFSQDLIITNDTEEIEVKVLEISPTTIYYQKKGQTIRRTINVEKVFMIKYANGETETFSVKHSSSSHPKQRLTGITKTTNLPRASRSYRLLDLYDENGVKGIVIETEDEGYHGKILSLDEKKLAFMKGAGLYAKTKFGLSDLYNGMNNQIILQHFISKSVMVTLRNFPAFEWCINHGKGWYLPAREELEQLYWTVNEGKAYNHKELNDALEAQEGDKVSFSFTSCYVSSTEVESSDGFIRVASKSFYIKDPTSWQQNETGRYEKENIRAMYRF